MRIDFLQSISLVVLALALIVLFSLLAALPVMWLWNWLIPSIFGLREIAWAEAWGLAVLSSILFKPSSVTKTEYRQG